MSAGILLEYMRKSRLFKNRFAYTGILSVILIFSFTSTSLLIINDVSDNQFQALSYVLKNYDSSFTVLASPTYSWILYDIFEWKNVPKDYSEILFYTIPDEKRVIIADSHYRIDFVRGPQIKEALENSKLVHVFNGNIQDFDSKTYPYTNMQANGEASNIEIRESIRGS
jgi:hypothetical protein